MDPGAEVGSGSRAASELGALGGSGGSCDSLDLTVVDVVSLNLSAAGDGGEERLLRSSFPSVALGADQGAPLEGRLEISSPAIFRAFESDSPRNRAVSKSMSNLFPTYSLLYISTLVLLLLFVLYHCCL